MGEEGLEPSQPKFWAFKTHASAKFRHSPTMVTGRGIEPSAGGLKGRRTYRYTNPPRYSLYILYHEISILSRIIL